MSLLRWGQEDDNKDQQDPFGLSPIKTVQSVQSAWQPTQDNAATPQSDSSTPQQNNNYLLSDQKAQIDTQIQQRRDAEAAAAAAAAAEAARVARETEAARNAQQQQPKPKTKTKYTNPNNKKDEGFWGFAKDIGSGIQQGLVNAGDVAGQAGAILNYINPFNTKSEQQKQADLVNYDNSRRKFLDTNKDLSGNSFTGTRDVEAAVTRINNGSANLQDYMALAGKGLQTGIDATGLLNPARAATTGIPSIARYALRDMGFFGGLQGVATTANTYGQTGDLGQSLEAGAKDALIGGVLQGSLDVAGHGVHHVANRTLNSLRRPEKALENAIDEAGVGAQNAERTKALNENGVPEDSNVSFQDKQQPADGTQSQLETAIRNEQLFPAGDTMVNTTPVADGVVQTPVEKQPSQMDNLTPVQTPETAQAAQVTPVADGTVQAPSKVVPTNDPNTPVIKSQEVRQLQDKKAGASQAEDAAINQRLREIENSSPEIRSVAEKAGIDNLDDYDGGLDKLEAALDDDRITFDEHTLMEDELYRRAEKRGDVIAEDGQGNLPDDITPAGAEPVGPAPAGKKKTPKKLTPEQQANKDFANRFVSMPAKDSGTRGRLASAVGLEQDAALPVRDILREGGVTGKKAERIADLSDRLDEILESKRQIQKDYRKTVIKGGEVDTAPARVRGRQTREEADLMAKLQSEIGSLELKGNKGERAMRALEGVIQAKNANQLFGAPVERGFTADVMGTAMYAAKNTIKMARSITQHGNPASSAWGTVKRGYLTPPKTVTEGYKYLVTNPYRTAMAPAQIAADMRRGAFRTEMTKWAYKEVKKGDLTNAQAEKISRMAGDDMEVLVNMGAGVDNGTVSLFRYRKALKQWKEFIKSGTDADYRKFMEVVDRQKTLADAISKGVVDKKYRVIAPLVNGLLPYMRNTVNMTTKGVALDLNPFTMGLIDAIRKDQRGWAANLALGIKNKTVDYAVLATLASTLVYNPSEDVDDQGVPPGVSIHMGGDNYFSIRGTPIELPLATIAMTKEIVQDTIDGKKQDWQYYGNMVKSSIPYVDYMDSHGNVLDSIANWGGKEGDSGYAAKNFMVSNTKSLIPFSNNNFEASLSRLDLDGDGSRSMNAKKVYDKDPKQWFANQLGNSGMGFLPFVPERSSLEDSRDTAGRVRTVNNQGSWMNKTINDANTKTYNSTITDLVTYARQNKLGNGTQEMFNTYPDGKNNNFKSLQDKITFLDAPEKNGKKTPDNAKKLEANPKLHDLSQQIYNGFFGDTSADLLTLDGTELRSDVAVPGKNNPGKNTNLPISIASIRNAIAQTDLPQEDWDKLNSISEAKSAIAERAKSGEIAWSQYYDALPEFSAQENAILANSPGNQKMSQLMTKLRDTGFFEPEGLGSTRSGQTYLWNSLNAMLGDKGKTPAAQWAESSSGKGSGFTPWGRGGGNGKRASEKPGDRGDLGIKWTPVKARAMNNVSLRKYTPVKVSVKLGNEVRRNKTQNYSDRSF